MFGIEIGLIIKAVLAISAIGGIVLAFRSYGKLIGRKERQKGIQEAEDKYAKNYKDLADDVLNGGHPYRVRDNSIAEISSSGVDTPKRMAANIQPEGESDRLTRDRNGSS